VCKGVLFHHTNFIWTKAELSPAKNRQKEGLS